MTILIKSTGSQTECSTPVVQIEKLPYTLIIDAGDYQLIFDEKETRQLKRLLS